jgi:hypothetical protein
VNESPPLGRILDRYSLQEPTHEHKDGVEHPAYSVIRGVGGHVLMLEVILKTGDSSAFGYSYFAGMHFDISGKLTLFFSGNKITVTGCNLRPIYEGLLNHSIGFLREENETPIPRNKSDTFIQSIKIERLE